MSTQIKRVANIQDREIDAEIENLIKQIPHSNDVVLKNNTGEPFIVNNFSELYTIDKDTATLDNVVDIIGTLLNKLVLSGIIKKQ